MKFPWRWNIMIFITYGDIALKYNHAILKPNQPASVAGRSIVLRYTMVWKWTTITHVHLLILLVWILLNWCCCCNPTPSLCMLSDILPWSTIFQPVVQPFWDVKVSENCWKLGGKIRWSSRFLKLPETNALLINLDQAYSMKSKGQHLAGPEFAWAGFKTNTVTFKLPWLCCFTGNQIIAQPLPMA